MIYIMRRSCRKVFKQIHTDYHEGNLSDAPASDSKKDLCSKKMKT